MRTTLAIDDDVLDAAKAISRQDRRSVGEVISDLARRALDRPAPEGTRNHVPLLASRPGVVITAELVNRLRDELT